MNKKNRFSLGPAILVTAAFIGPGTVLTASKAGAGYGFVLLWAVAFSVIATIILQVMAARIGIVTGDGLSQAMKSSVANPFLRVAMLGLVLVAILVGNAAYQTGNILGAAKGVSALTQAESKNESVETEPRINDAVKSESAGSEPAAWSGIESNNPIWTLQNTLVVAIGCVALAVIWIGRFDILQGLLTALVALMSVLFIVAAIQCKPNWAQVLAGFAPRIPTGSELFIVGLIGTTVVPYNLFLHASAAAQRWDFLNSESVESETKKAIQLSRWDTVISVLIGGAVTAAILITASVAFYVVSGDAVGLAEGTKGADAVAVQLEPVLGSWAKSMYAIGLCAAGLTSAITAPIAAGYAASGCFGWSGRLSDWRLKSIASLVVVTGVLLGVLLGKSPTETIILAQVANGLLLPIIAVMLLIMANQTKLMNQFRNSTAANIAGVIVIGVTILIGFKNLALAYGKISELLQ